MTHGAAWFMGRHGLRSNVVHEAVWLVAYYNLWVKMIHDSRGNMNHGVI